MHRLKLKQGHAMTSLALWLTASGIAALSFECWGAAFVLLGFAGLLIGHA